MAPHPILTAPEATTSANQAPASHLMSRLAARKRRSAAASRDTGTKTQPLSTEEFDRLVAGLDYPVFVVTTAHETARAGCLVGFATQVSIGPPRFLVCLSVNNRTYDVARHASLIAVHVLAPSQHDLAELFGSTTGDEVDKFSQCRWQPGPNDIPLLQDCQRRIVGRILEQHQFGDHVGFVLEPLKADVASNGPGLSFEQVQDIDPGHSA